MSISGNRSRRAAALLAWGAPLSMLLAAPAPAADVTLSETSDQGVNLDTFAGASAEILAGVTLSNDFATLMPGPTSGTYAALYAATPWTLTNRGIVDNFSNAVTFVGGGTVLNHGSLLSEFNGIDMAAGGTVHNHAGAVIDGAAGGVIIKGGGSLTNGGRIIGNAGTTVIIENGGTVTNQSGGVIENLGGSTAVSLVRGEGVNKVENAGTISDLGGRWGTGVAIRGGEVVNHADSLIEGRYNAIWAVSGAAATITNAGTLAATDGGGIEMAAGGSITNSGTISGKLGIEVTGGGAAIVNAGSISGTDGIAIKFANGTNSLTLLPGFTLGGSVLGGLATDTFILDGAADTEGLFDGDSQVLTGFELAEKTGAGSWTLAGTAPGFAPAIAVKAGLLAVDGSYAGLAAEVRAGAVLGGIGSLGGIEALAGGRVAPGRSIGTLTAAQASFSAGSFFEVELDGLLSDELVVTGTALIDPGASVHVAPAPGLYAVGQEYRILSAGTRAGSFGSLTDSSAFLSFALDHDRDPGEVWLRVVSVSDIAGFAGTPNQSATARGLSGLPGSSPILAAITPLSTEAAALAFDQLSGEIHAALPRLLVEDSRYPREAALARIAAGLAAPGDVRPVWARLVGGFGTVGADGNAGAASFASGGLLMGGEALLAPHALAGIEVGVTRHGMSLPARGASAQATGLHLGAYGGLAHDQLRLALGASYAHYALATRREPAAGAFTDTLEAGYGLGIGQVFGEAGYAIALDGMELRPFLRAALIGHSSTSYDETGGPAALAGGAAGGVSALVEAGLRAETRFVLASGLAVEASAVAGLAHHAGETPRATHAFAGGSPFTVSAAGFGTGLFAGGTARFALSDAVTMTLSADARWGKGGVAAAGSVTLGGSF